MRKTILTILGLLLIVASFFIAKLLIDNKNKVKPIAPKVVKVIFADTVKNSTIPIVIPANGNLTAKRRFELYAEVEGIFKPGSVLFKPGQEYRKGQTLIRIEDSEYYATVQSAKSDLYNAIAAIMADLRLDFPEVYPKWDAYLRSFDLNKATPKLPEMTSEKENYFITGRSIVSNYYNVKNLEQRLSKYIITTPFNGILTEALVNEGTLIRSGQKLGTFIDPSVYEMEVAISKSFASLLQVGETVALNNLEGTETYTGKVSRVNGSVDPNTQTIQVYIEVKHDNLKEGMYLEANVDARDEENAIQIDRNLLLETKEIFVVRDSVLDVIPVKPIHFSDTKVVLKDVPDGSVIVSRPIQGGYAGMLVKVFNEQNN
ncbi:HlyD family efflux transporter periplasmic adaptor subunit [Formosa sediminum]|uniref:HlyD family efflux transporter periplasmic adaptor subunit n=1 Tax=Formosa sediminum TaxID=2594004 RepID=A0A516GQ09_9FLAO|nr:HlyD family efflux transporter periplasmic adaptor subunit [Formosa sediminum]QDO93450.1 HlyD family efflux transporter periplasmic adaptor subunit [Formosa sediminum]